MHSVEQQIEQAWRRGKDALDAAANKLSRVEAADPGHTAAIVSLRRGALSTALDLLKTSDHIAVVEAELRIAVQARNRVVELAMESYGAGLMRMASGFSRVLDRDDCVADAWVKVLRNVYMWRQRGSFRSWVSAVFRHALCDGAEAHQKASGKLRTFADEHELLAAPAYVPRLAAAGDSSRGTTRRGGEFALMSFKASLDRDRAAMWEAAMRLEAEGMRPEEIYKSLSERLGKTSGAIKAVLGRLRREFSEMIGAPTAEGIDAANVVTLWIGSVSFGATTVLLAEGIDASDQRWMLATRPAAAANRAAFSRMFEALRRAGLRTDRRVLVVIDDSEGLHESTSATFNGCAVIQLCTRTLVRAVVDELPAADRSRFQSAAGRAYAVRDPVRARRMLTALADELQTCHPAAAARLRDGIEASLTVKRFGLPTSLEDDLSRVEFFGEIEAAPSSLLARLAAIFVRLRGRRSVDRRVDALLRLAAELGGSKHAAPRGG